MILSLFRYKAVTPQGETQDGEMDGISQAAIVERLQGMTRTNGADMRDGFAQTFKDWTHFGKGVVVTANHDGE